MDGIYEDSDLTDVHKINTSLDYKQSFPSEDGSFVQTYSDISENEDAHSPMQFSSARQFELEFKLHEAEQKIEQLTLQLKGKAMQLEQVQVALMSCEEEIMQLRNPEVQDSGDSIQAPQASNTEELIESPEGGGVSLETAEQLSTKIIKLQERVEELEDTMVITKLDNAQLKETNDFLKSKLRQIPKRTAEKKPPTKTSSVRSLFGRR